MIGTKIKELAEAVSTRDMDQVVEQSQNGQ